MFKIPQKVKNDSQKFKDNLDKFLSGKINSAFFKGIRVPWGNYSERGGKFLMSRLRIPGGILSPDQLRAVALAAKQFAASKVHLTTRQDIQIHNVKHEDSFKIIEYLSSFNISPRGGGGNTVRNVTGCYLSGICTYENVNIHNIVCGLSEYLLSLDESYNLPRKFKIAFSACDHDCAFTGVNDVGFIYKDNGFKVLCGGGMGAKSIVGRVLKENVQEDEVGYIVRAIMNVFYKHGDRKNRHRNRLRFLIEDIGWDKFVEFYNDEHSKVKNEEYIVLRKDEDIILPELDLDESALSSKNEEDFQTFFKHNVQKQKKKGYYFIQIRIPQGEIMSDQLINLTDLAKGIPAISFRTTHRQNIIISNVPYNKIFSVYKEIKKIFENYLYPENIVDILSCKGASTCNLGVCNAIALAPEITNQLLKLNLDFEKLKGIKININGCPNSCGQHPLGTISLSGLAKKVYGRTVPFYKIYVGGNINAEKTAFAKEIGVIPARNAPKFLSEMVLLIQNNSNDNISEYLNLGRPAFTQLINKYCYVPAYEEDKSFYVDFGKNEDFSLDGLSQGECGAGAIDMIEADILSAKTELNKALDSGYNIANIKESILHSSRALLIVKGIDPKDDKDIIDSFIKKFIDAKICNPKFNDLSAVYGKIISGSFEKKEDAYNYAKELSEEVDKIYSLMDSSFNFPVRYSETEEKKELLKESAPNIIYDLRGTPCPMNYIKTKLKLEEMNKGDFLEVLLDEGEPIENVPKSLLNDGQKILKNEHIDNYHKILVEKMV